MSDGDPLKEVAIEKKSLLEYWFNLDMKIKEAEKEIARAKQQPGKSYKNKRR